MARIQQLLTLSTLTLIASANNLTWTNTTNCVWGTPGCHDAGYPCSTWNDCYGDMTCVDGACTDCVWGTPGCHDTGYPCSTWDDCYGDMTCVDGACTDCVWGTLGCHDAGYSCSTWDDCYGDMICVNGVCAEAVSDVHTCSWAGRCLGDSCTTYDDCSDDLFCSSGSCIASEDVEVFAITIGCWTQTWEVPAGDGCWSECRSTGRTDCCAPTEASADRVLVTGEHWNVGTDSVEVSMRDRITGAMVLSNFKISALHEEGKVAGSWELKTYFDCGSINYVAAKDVFGGTVKEVYVV